jgi:NTE family protein
MNTNGSYRNSRLRVGVALGGGVVRGFAHVGVLSVLEAADIPIDFVSGTSVGSIIGAFYCAGMKLVDVDDMAARINWLALSRPVLARKGLVSFDRLERWLIQELGDLHFEDLAIPFAVSVTDMEAGENVILDSGPLAPAVRASCSVPGFVTPVRLGGRLLADGGVSNNVPVNILREMGADYVIGVDIFQHYSSRSWGPLGPGLTALEIMIRHAGGSIEAADCVITPELSGQTYFRFGKRLGLIELGQKAAVAQLPCIQEALAVKEQSGQARENGHRLEMLVASADALDSN